MVDGAKAVNASGSSKKVSIGALKERINNTSVEIYYLKHPRRSGGDVGPIITYNPQADLNLKKLEVKLQQMQAELKQMEEKMEPTKVEQKEPLSTLSTKSSDAKNMTAIEPMKDSEKNSSSMDNYY